MRKKILSKHCCRTLTIWSAAFLFGSFAGIADAQQNPPPTPAQTQNPNPDVTQGEVASFDAFLDNHPQLDKDLRSDPSLITNKAWVQNHPELQAYLTDHPVVRDEILENPSYFIHRENRYEARERQRRDQADRDRDANGRGQSANPDVTRGEVTSFDQFLDRNPGIDRELTANPSLVNNPQYLQQHPELQAFLRDHQNVRAELTENPNDFMSRERRYDAREARQYQQPGAVNYDVTRSELASFDQFLDRHPDVDRELSANPSLVNNAQYLQQHPGLQAYLTDHPNVKEELTETPNYFMKRESRYDAMEDQARRQNQTTQGQNTQTQGTQTQGGATTSRETRNGRANPDLTQGEIASFDQFLDDHQDINKQLEKNPQLVNEAGYVKKHKALETYLNQHPGVREELTENPAYFMKRENRFELSERDRMADARDNDRARNTQTGDMRTDRDADHDLDAAPARLSQKDMRETDKFLGKHKKIDKDLRKNPELANDRDYLQKHKDLQAFMEKNPDIHEAARRNPSEFMRNQQRFEHMNHRTKVPPPEENKSKAEKREDTRPATPH